MRTCGNCGFRAAGGRCACSTRSIHGGPRSCSLAGDKTGDKRFYEKFVPIADRLYDEHLEELRKEATNGR